MPSLARFNQYLRNPSKRLELTIENTRESSIFEGARNLKNPKASHTSSRKRRSIASAKNARNGS
jgi:hypothetical protein